jgi:hypothetical protein
MKVPLTYLVVQVWTIDEVIFASHCCVGVAESNADIDGVCAAPGITSARLPIRT